MNFDQLITLFQATHTTIQNQALRSVDIDLVIRNWLFGWYLIEFEQHGHDRAKYGKRTLQELSDILTGKIGRGFSVDNLELMRRLFLGYQDIIQGTNNSETLFRNLEEGTTEISSKLSLNLQTVVLQLKGYFKLGWSHYVTLLSLKNNDERNFYEIETVANSWSIRELKRQMASSLYERLALSRDKNQILDLSKQGLAITSPADIIKNPYVLEFLGLPEHYTYSEHDLETAIIDKLEHFLLELGKGFLFEARQKRFTFEDDHFYVDLVFYNRLLHCYVLIDLKRDKLTHQDLGQMQMYVNYFDRYIKTETESPTIGIVLCHQKHDALVELTLPKGSNIYASEYQLYLPSKEELRQRLLEWSAGEDNGK